MLEKKFWLILLALASALCLAFGLTACSKGEKANEGDTWTMDHLYAKAQELGFEGTLEELIAEFKGEAGKDCKDGKDVTNGADGKDGITPHMCERELVHRRSGYRHQGRRKRWHRRARSLKA